MSTQFDRLTAAAELLNTHPELDGELYIVVNGTGSLDLQINTRKPDKRDAVFLKLIGIISSADNQYPVTHLQRDGRAAWITFDGVYLDVRVELSAHYSVEEAEALHAIADRKAAVKA